MSPMMFGDKAGWNWLSSVKQQNPLALRSAKRTIEHDKASIALIKLAQRVVDIVESPS